MTLGSKCSFSFCKVYRALGLRFLRKRKQVSLFGLNLIPLQPPKNFHMSPAKREHDKRKMSSSNQGEAADMLVFLGDHKVISIRKVV